MRKFNKKYLQIGVIAFITICCCILFYFILFNGETFVKFFNRIIYIFRPIIIGVFLAYILNPLMTSIENNVFIPINKKLKIKYKSEVKSKKVTRAFSVFSTIIIFICIIYAIINMIVPQVIESIESIIARIPAFINQCNTWINNLIFDNKDISDMIISYLGNLEDWFLTSIVPRLQDAVTTFSSNIISGVVSTIKIMLNIIIGLIVAIYLLSQKELFCAQAKKITYALLREERANNLINNMRFANKTFGGFLSGKIIDSLIIGILTFAIISIFNIPYKVLISVIVGVTNIIPYFGPFLGAIPCAIILLMVDPFKCITFLIIVLILQQVDGNIIGPKILGDSTGLSSFWVIFAITLFGGFFGVFGMFIGVPLFAVIYAAIRTFVNQRLEKKRLPSDTVYYMTSDFHSDENTTNAGSEIKFVKKVFENVYVEGFVAEHKSDLNNVVSETSNSSEESDS